MQIPHHAEREYASSSITTGGGGSEQCSSWAPVAIRADPVGAFAAARMLEKEMAISSSSSSSMTAIDGI